MPPTTPDPARTLSDERFQLLVERMIDYAIYMLDADGFVTSWNAGAQRTTGYAAEEAIGEHFSGFFEGQERADGLPARILAQARSKGTCEHEGWRARKDGSKFFRQVHRLCRDHPRHHRTPRGAARLI